MRVQDLLADVTHAPGTKQKGKHASVTRDEHPEIALGLCESVTDRRISDLDPLIGKILAQSNP